VPGIEKTLGAAAVATRRGCVHPDALREFHLYNLSGLTFPGYLSGPRSSRCTQTLDAVMPPKGSGGFWSGWGLRPL
jgi:hypothetical protein